MKQVYEEPIINISYFHTENIVTVSGTKLAEEALNQAGATDVQKMDLQNAQKITFTW